MKKCIDCDFRFTCGKANSEITCERFKRTAGTVTKLDEIDNGYYKFSRLEAKDGEVI